MTFSETDRELWLRVEVSDDGCLNGGFCLAEKGRDGNELCPAMVCRISKPRTSASRGFRTRVN